MLIAGAHDQVDARHVAVHVEPFGELEVELEALGRRSAAQPHDAAAYAAGNASVTYQRQYARVPSGSP